MQYNARTLSVKYPIMPKKSIHISLIPPAGDMMAFLVVYGVNIFSNLIDHLTREHSFQIAMLRFRQQNQSSIINWGFIAHLS